MVYCCRLRARPCYRTSPSQRKREAPCPHERQSPTLVFLRSLLIRRMEIMKEAKELTGFASVEAIRAQFPALDRRHNGYPVAYFDGPGGTQVPRAVVEAMADYLYHHNANTHWAYPTSAETDAAIETARQACADFLNAAPDEIAFGANMTTLTFHLARALGAKYGPGDEIV